MKTVRIALLAALALTAANTMRAADTRISITGAGGVIALIDQYNATTAQAAADTAQKAAALQTLATLQSVYDQATAPGSARSYVPIFMEKTGFDTAGIAAKKAVLEGQTREQAALTVQAALRAEAARRKAEQLKAAAKIGDAVQARAQQQDAPAKFAEQREATRILQAAERRRKQQQAQAESAAKQKSGETLTAAARRALEERKRAEQRAAATKIEQAEQQRRARQELEKRRKEKQEKDTAAAILQAAERRRQTKVQLCMQATSETVLAGCIETLRAELNRVSKTVLAIRQTQKQDKATLTTKTQKFEEQYGGLTGYFGGFMPSEDRKAAEKEMSDLQQKINVQEQELTRAQELSATIGRKIGEARKALGRRATGGEKEKSDGEKKADDEDAASSTGGGEGGEEGKSREEGGAGDEEEKAAELKAAQEKFDAAMANVAELKGKIQEIIDSATAGISGNQKQLVENVKNILANKNTQEIEQSIRTILESIRARRAGKQTLAKREIDFEKLLPQYQAALNAQAAAQAALDALSAE